MLEAVQKTNKADLILVYIEMHSKHLQELNRYNVDIDGMKIVN